MPVNPGDRYQSPTKTQQAASAVVAAVRATKDVAVRGSLVTVFLIGEIVGYIARGLR